MLWKDTIGVEVLWNDFQFVHLRVKFPELDNWVVFSGIYGSPCRQFRRAL